MLQSELIDLINSVCKQKTESNVIEVKAAKLGYPKIKDTLSSFSNQPEGGTIIFGIDENDNYNICGVYDANDLQKKIVEDCKQMEPNVRAFITMIVIDDKQLVSAEIPGLEIYDKPCYYKGVGISKGSYIRVGDADVHMTEYEVYNYKSFKQKIHDELRQNNRAKFENINTPMFDKYVAELRIKKPNLASLSVTEICNLQGFTVEDKPTLASILLFSKYPQAFFPQLCITAVSIPSNEMGTVGTIGERFIDNKRIDGTLEQMLEGAMQFVLNNMHIKTVISNTTGERTDITDYPITAIREILLNALVHRDYSMYTENTPITIRMFKNRIEIENPGSLYGNMTLEQLGYKSADARNPFIVNALEVLGKVENRYSGIPIIRKLMQNANLPKPKFEDVRGSFRVTLYNDTYKADNDIKGETNLFQ